MRHCDRRDLAKSAKKDLKINLKFYFSHSLLLKRFKTQHTLSPIIDRIRVVMKNILQNVAGSWKNTMPTITAPTAPIPVHTG